VQEVTTQVLEDCWVKHIFHSKKIRTIASKPPPEECSSLAIDRQLETIGPTSLYSTQNSRIVKYLFTFQSPRISITPLAHPASLPKQEILAPHSLT
jgi:hypothetical protein